MMGYVYDEQNFVGELSFDGQQYIFQYDNGFVEERKNISVSLTLPKQKEPFFSKHLHPFFANLLAEGDLKKVQCKELKIDENDEFTRLIKTAHSETIGAITIRESR